MAIKTFASGEILTASDTNTYLTNGGLVYVTSTTVGSGVSSVTISNCFSSTYSFYEILVNNVQVSTSQALCIQFGATATAYYGAITYTPYNATAVSVANNNNDTKLFVALTDSTAPSTSTKFTVFAPNLAQKTQIAGLYYGRGYMGQFGGSLENNTVYTDIKFFNESGTLTGGTITVYGYRKA